MGTSNNVIDLSALKKKQFDVNGKVLELDTADLNILARFQSMYPTLYEEGAKLAKIEDMVKNSTADDGQNLTDMVQVLNDADKAMRDAIDFIFDSNVCEICIDHGSLFDPINGEYRFEHVINALLPLYEKDLQEETKKIQQRVKKHTDKYTKKK